MTMNLLEQQSTFAKNVAKLLVYIFDEGHLCTLGEAFRTKEQAEIYAKSGKGIKDSLHCERLAIDLNLFTFDGKYLDKTDDYHQIGEYWESLHPRNRWGGRFKERPDGNHFQMTPEDHLEK